MLTQSRLKELLEYDPETGDFHWRVRPVRCKQNATWNSAWAGKIAGTISTYGYVMINVQHYQPMRAHRLAFLYMTGKFPQVDVDHINGIM